MSRRRQKLNNHNGFLKRSDRLGYISMIVQQKDKKTTVVNENFLRVWALLWSVAEMCYSTWRAAHDHWVSWCRPQLERKRIEDSTRSLQHPTARDRENVIERAHPRVRFPLSPICCSEICLQQVNKVTNNTARLSIEDSSSKRRWYDQGRVTSR